jgi:hypothetical protein
MENVWPSICKSPKEAPATELRSLEGRTTSVNNLREQVCWSDAYLQSRSDSVFQGAGCSQNSSIATVGKYFGGSVPRLQN